MTNTLALKVVEIEKIGDGILSIELRGTNVDILPEFTAGSHIPLYLPNNMTRNYSLTNSQDERDRYIIAVGKSTNSRGGSLYIHNELRVGDILTSGLPRNNFSFVENADRSIFIAGGIGITPYMSMIRRALHLELEWKLYYSARSKEAAAFLDQISALTDRCERVTTHFDEEMDGKFLDLRKIVSDAPQFSHLYCCGPQPMLAAFEQACVDFPSDQVHMERFAHAEKPAVVGGFTVILARQQRSIYVPEGCTILDALLAEGVDVPFACREGVCGTCEVTVLDGIPIHHDTVLSRAEREENRTMMICCSGSLTPDLTLDI